MIIKMKRFTWRQWVSIVLTAYACAVWATLSFLTNRNTVKNKSQLIIEQPLDRFASDIQAFELEDEQHPTPEVGTLFIGSSTFSLASALLQDKFADLRPLVRAFGGSTIPEINFYIEQTVLKYKPKQICFYAGSNDIADGHSGRRVFDDFSKFAEVVHARLPETQIFFVSMSVAPSRLQWHEQYSIGNRLVRKFAKRSLFVHFIDVTYLMYDGWGNLRRDWFLEDELHMNSNGYEAWIPVLRNALEPSANYPMFQPLVSPLASRASGHG